MFGVVGAGREANIVVDSETVSRRHVELTLVAEGVQVTDLGSRNGTFYLGQRVGQLTVRLGSLTVVRREAGWSLELFDFVP